MRIYKISANCLVDFCMLYWYVKARNEKEAWLKGFLLVRKSPVADEGSVDCKRLKEIPGSIKLSHLYEVQYD